MIVSKAERKRERKDERERVRQRGMRRGRERGGLEDNVGVFSGFRERVRLRIFVGRAHFSGASSSSFSSSSYFLFGHIFTTSFERHIAIFSGEKSFADSLQI